MVSSVRIKKKDTNNNNKNKNNNNNNNNKNKTEKIIISLIIKARADFLLFIIECIKRGFEDALY